MSQLPQERLRVGIVGCGYQGGRMVEAIARTESLVAVACADPDTEAAIKLADIVGHAMPYSSVDDMLASTTMDAVVVATPHHVLAEVSLKAIEANLHVLAEKPIGINTAEADQIEQAVAKAGVCYMAGYSFRYVGALQQVHDLLVAGAVGEILAVSGSIGIGPIRSGWKSSLSTGGGPLFYIGSHLIDEVLWFVQDDPVEVYANIRYCVDRQADETSVFELSFAKGATAQCLVTQAGDWFYNNVDIYGREGRISLRGPGFLDYEIAATSKALRPYATPTVIRPRLNDDRIILMHVPQLEEFAAAIREHRQPAVDIGAGRRVLQVIDGIFASDASGQVASI